jgi:lysophospholipase L1-like esterase
MTHAPSEEASRVHDAARGSRRAGAASVRRAPALVVMAASFVLALGVAELVLRALGFRYELRLHMVESTAPVPEETKQDYTIDRDLTWVPNDYADTLRRALAEHPGVAFLGDSCTQLGWYDEYFRTFVSERFPGRRVRTANLASAGWTSHQGLQQMRRDVTRIRPRLATIYYGWNDHWLSIGLDDGEVARLNASPLFRLQTLRLAQLATRAYVGMRSRREHLAPVRVPPEEFRNNLVQMVRVARGAGIVPVLLTAPSSHEVGREPEYLVGRWVRDKSDLVALHRRYVTIVREVSRDEKAPLCDLAADLDALPRDQVRTLFQEDGIHLTDDGNKVVAGALLQCLERLGLLQQVLE